MTTRVHLDRLTDDEIALARKILREIPKEKQSLALGLYSPITMWKALAGEEVSSQTAIVIRSRLERAS